MSTNSDFDDFDPHPDSTSLSSEWIPGKKVKSCKETKNNYRYLTEDTIEVKLTRDFTMLIDVEDLPLVQQTCWSVRDDGGGSEFYAAGKLNGKETRFHRVIMNCGPSGVVQHLPASKDEVFLFLIDNRKKNLRISTPKENLTNEALRITSNREKGIDLLRRESSVRTKWWYKGEKHAKTFSYAKPKSLYQTETEAYQAAVSFRKAKIAEIESEKTDCTNGEQAEEKHSAIESSDSLF